MVIGIDGNEANVEKKVGVSVYTLKLLEYFQKQAAANLQFKIFLRQLPLADLPQPTDFFQYEIVQGNFLWSQLFLPIALYKNRFNRKKLSVFFAPAHYAPRLCPFPIVTTIHDLSYFYYPQEFLKKDLYQLKNWTQYSVEKAQAVIAVSQTTKKDLVKFYKIPEEKTTVIYNGYEKRYQQTTNRQLPTTNHQYILFVGTLQPRKNISCLIKAFCLFSEKYPDFRLIITGKKGWLYEDIMAEAQNSSCREKITFTDYVSDHQLAELYQNAACYVLPSFYEGFGIPVLEAMSYGCPVICSFTASLPEVAADAALYFDPDSYEELAEKLSLLQENKDLKKELIKKGRERITQFSWTKCAKETLELLKIASKYDQSN